MRACLLAGRLAVGTAVALGLSWLDSSVRELSQERCWIYSNENAN